jgi:hypothetical protein
MHAITAHAALASHLSCPAEWALSVCALRPQSVHSWPAPQSGEEQDGGMQTPSPVCEIVLLLCATQTRTSASYQHRRPLKTTLTLACSPWRATGILTATRGKSPHLLPSRRFPALLRSSHRHGPRATPSPRTTRPTTLCVLHQSAKRFRVPRRPSWVHPRTNSPLPNRRLLRSITRVTQGKRFQPGANQYADPVTATWSHPHRLPPQSSYTTVSRGLAYRQHQRLRHRRWKLTRACRTLLTHSRQ